MYFPECEELPSTLREHVARSLLEVEGQRQLVVLGMSVPYAPLSVFLRAVQRDMSLLWDPGADGRAYATAGVVRRIDIRGADRLSQLLKGVASVCARITVKARPDCQCPPPRLFGGIAFAAGQGGKRPWTEFSDGCFILPQWTYSRGLDDEHGVLCLTIDGQRDRGLSRQQEILAQLDEILEALCAYEGDGTRRTAVPGPPCAPGARVHQLDYERWRAQIERIQGAIKQGHYAKIVASRCAEVELSSAATRPGRVDDVEVLQRLSAEPGCTRFAFRGAESTFLGATPETLFEKRGVELRTHALAGTRSSMSSDLPALSQRSIELLASEKDRAEHEFVVHDIRESLQDLCETIDTPSRPGVSKIRSILHLSTEIRARLRPGVSAPQILAALHPTPAVGGLPKRGAAEWLCANEPHSRGWYTGAMGWIDVHGDARFVVAIRCGLLTPERAFIYTGAGIVGGSEPEAEYAETELKQLPLLRALGVVA